ncbi:MAG: hypothetical protein AAB548_01810 [Patescibacteria group bacterium]
MGREQLMTEKTAAVYQRLQSWQAEDEAEAQTVQRAKEALVAINRTRKMGRPESGCVISSMTFTHGQKTIEERRVTPLIDDLDLVKDYSQQFGGVWYETHSLSVSKLRDFFNSHCRAWFITVRQSDSHLITSHMFAATKSPRGLNIFDVGPVDILIQNQRLGLTLDATLKDLHAHILHNHRDRTTNPIILIGFGN